MEQADGLGTGVASSGQRAPVSVVSRVSTWSRAAGARILGIARRRDAGAERYVAAVGIRTVARASWGLAIPAVLSVSAYGHYNLLTTMVVIAVQVAMLGGPQALVQFAGRPVPTVVLLLHSSALALAVLAVVTAVAPPGDGTVIGVAAIAICGTAVYTLLAARAKARFAFGTSLRAEICAALVLLAGVAVLFVRGRTCGADCTSPAFPVLVEAIAVIGAALIFLTARSTRLERSDCSTRGTRPLLASVYSVGFLAVLDMIIWRRLDVYFLERSPDGLTGVAVFGLALQFATLLLLVPTAMLETWQPRLAILYRTDRAAFHETVRSKRRLFSLGLLITGAAGLAVPTLAVTVVFPKYLPWLGYVLAIVLIRVAYAAAGFYSATMYATGLERWLYRPMLIGSVVALGAHTVLTLHLGLAGAIAAQVLTQGTVSLLTILAFRRAMRGGSPARPDARAGEATARCA